MRITWIIVFVVGSLIIAWYDMNSGFSSGIVLFLCTAFWSAICGIGYSICDQFLTTKSSSFEGKPDSRRSSEL
jgi:hypothetical protein